MYKNEKDYYYMCHGNHCPRNFKNKKKSIEQRSDLSNVTLQKDFKKNNSDDFKNNYLRIYDTDYIYFPGK